MFLALRDLRFAKGRFALMGGVIVLISLLVVMLTGLTAGLSQQSTSAITSLPGNRVALSAPPAGGGLSYTQSTLPPGAQATAEKQPGVQDVATLRIAQAAVSVDGRNIASTLFAAQPGDFIAPKALGPHQVVVSSALDAGKQVRVGDTVQIAGVTFTVAGTLADASFSHLPVVWLPQSAWHQVASEAAGGSVLVMRTGSGFDAARFDAATQLRSMPTGDSLSAIGSYSAEHGSLTLMQLMLLGISALVIGAFFTVWTIGRTPDLAVLKAMGARTWYLIRDALGEALILLLVGGGIGTGIATAAGLAVRGSVPFVVDLSTTLVPLTLLVGIGILGAAAAVRRIGTVDPITALGAAR